MQRITKTIPRQCLVVLQVVLKRRSKDVSLSLTASLTSSSVLQSLCIKQRKIRIFGGKSCLLVLLHPQDIPLLLNFHYRCSVNGNK